MGVSLSKNQTVSLAKAARSSLNAITIGLGWDPAKNKGFFASLFGGEEDDSIDLDASCVLLDAFGNEVETVWFRNLESSCGSVIHSGDNLTGEGEGDDESIFVDLQLLPANIEHLAFTVNSFRGQTFNEVENAFCRVLDHNEQELAKYILAEKGSHTGVLITVLSRNGGAWEFSAKGKACRGRTVKDMLPQIREEI